MPSNVLLRQPTIYYTARRGSILRRQLTTPGNISAAVVYLHPIDIQHIVCTRQLDGKEAARRKANRLARLILKMTSSRHGRESRQRPASRTRSLLLCVYISRLRQLPRCARNRPNIVKKYTREKRERERLSWHPSAGLIQHELVREPQ